MAKYEKNRDLELLKLAANGKMVEFCDFCTKYYCERSWMNVYHRKSGDTLLLVAARNGQLDFIKHLQSMGVDMNQTNLDGKNALHEAAHSSSEKCVRYLLTLGIEIDSLKRADW